ncbi:SMC-Scp complex subunit ScpB, partial [Escherichia coli]|nr:SMC-Scp complex subunit ScpB [Escherichia coli]
NDIATAIEECFEYLAQEYTQQNRGFELHHNLQGWQLVNTQEFEQVVAHFIADGQTARLSQAALETLAIIAYKQPMTRAQV